MTPFVGVKAMIDELQVDMHQREEETYIESDHTTQVLHKKPLCAAEVVIKGLELRALIGSFSEPSKRQVPLPSPAKSAGPPKPAMTSTAPWDLDKWIDPDDFVETDWEPHGPSTVDLLPVVSCPRIAYFKKPTPSSPNTVSKFGTEDTHVCQLGTEPSVPETQAELALARIKELVAEKRRTAKGTSREGVVSLLRDYVDHLRGVKAGEYHISSDTFSEKESEGFENVFQIYSPSIFIDMSIRDALLKYYHLSRARVGIEYQMSTRAVKFLRDSAVAALEAEMVKNLDRQKEPQSNAAQAFLRKILPETGPKTSFEVGETDAADPMSGWTEGVKLRKGTFGLLLKPQIILRSKEDSKESVCILATVQAKLQSYGIMDSAHINDAVSGQVMTRTYTALSGLQTFCPADPGYRGNGFIPLEVLLDLRCESVDFDRLVPQTDATFHWDKFNRLRLLNNTSIAEVRGDPSSASNNNHLRNQTDRIRIHVPRFTVSASDEHFEAMTAIVTKLVLFSDATQQTRMDKLETLLFSYDFTDLKSAATVIAKLQSKQRGALEMQRRAGLHLGKSSQTHKDMLKLKAHIFLLAEELNYMFSAIQMAQRQDRNDPADQKSAVLLHASSDNVSWMMLDVGRDVLAKLVVSKIDYSWLRRRDAVAVNHVTVHDLEVFDMSPDPNLKWYDILAKSDSDKDAMFIEGTWTVQPPVGGITIYDSFIFQLHPMRLQIDGKVGRRMFEYFFPARRREVGAAERTSRDTEHPPPSRKSLDVPRPAKQNNTLSVQHPLRKPRSFTDIRSMTMDTRRPAADKPSGSDLNAATTASAPVLPISRTNSSKNGDATEMKTRSHLKTFVLVKISSVNLLLSVTLEDSFDLRDARIKTRELEYRNRTCTFEELVKQFIPDDMSWKGWVKMALHQPLLPVLPVARELISKTKWINRHHDNGHPSLDASSPEKPTKRLAPPRPTPQRSRSSSPVPAVAPAAVRHRKIASSRPLETPTTPVAAALLTDEPQPMQVEDPETRPPFLDDQVDPEEGRTSRAKRIKTLFTRGHSRTRKSTESSNSKGPGKRGPLRHSHDGPTLHPP